VRFFVIRYKEHIYLSFYEILGLKSMKKLDLKRIKIRPAVKHDTGVIFDFIRSLALYEKRLHELSVTEADISDVLFERKIAEAVIAEYEKMPVGFAVFFYNFSTFTGKTGIYIEDLYVSSRFRRSGIGKLILSYIARLAVERKCDRLEWTVLKWNEPSLEFYRKLEAEPKDEWVIYKMSGEALYKLAGI